MSLIENNWNKFFLARILGGSYASVHYSGSCASEARSLVKLKMSLRRCYWAIDEIKRAHWSSSN